MSMVREVQRLLDAKSDLRLEYGVAGAAGVVTIPPSTVAVSLPYLNSFAEDDHVAVLTMANGDRLILGPVTQP